MANILIVVTGSIASYKAADLVSSLKKQGHDVTVLMTEAAREFIQPLTLQVLSQNPVHLDVMQEPYPDQVNHIEKGKETDLFIVVPATANTIAKLAYGFADNMVTSTALALPSHIPKLLAPAMNTKMYDHPATQTNLKTLETYGYKLISPKESLLACMTSIFIIPKETPVFLIPRFAQYIPSLVQTVTGADGFACRSTLKRTQHTRIMLTTIGIHAPALVVIPIAIH